MGLSRKGRIMDNNGSSNGIGLWGLLLVAFIVLKLTNVITWSWWWVLSPLWIGLPLGIIIMVALYVLARLSVMRGR